MKTLQLVGYPYPKQIQFFKCTKKSVAYGGARGGGKSWALRRKLVLMCSKYPGIQILLIRRTLKDLRKNHELPLMAELEGFAKYDKQNKEFHFPNGSMLTLGYCDSESDVLQYQGQSYDVIGMEEATQFTEFQYECLTECNRRSGTMQGDFTSRMYLTCNPGGVGHVWVKRLFIDREYRNKEEPGDYDFIPSKVYDNEYIMKNDPDYVRALENLPEMRKRAMLYGDWDAFEGQYYPEFRRDIHVIKPIELPAHWKRFRSLDYGLDMTACYWWAVSPDGREYIYRELYQPGLTLRQAAGKILELTPDDEEVSYTVASPDLWNRRQDTGVSGEEIMSSVGLKDMQKADNRRIPGWRTLREHLQPFIDEQGVQVANLRIFENCTNLIRCMPLLMHDEKHPEDAASEPHEVTHGPESIRYGVMSRPGYTHVSASVDLSKLPQDLQDDYYNAPDDIKPKLLKKWGLI